MKRFLRIVPLLTVLWSVSLTASAAPLSEEKYLALVSECNGELQSLRKEVEARVLAIRAELAFQRPSFAFVAEESRWVRHDRGDRYMDLTVTQRVDLAGRYGLQERELFLGLEILRSRYDDAENATLARAASTYRRAVIAALNREMTEQILRRRRESLRVTQEMFDKELVPRLDLLRAKSQVDDGEALYLQARQNYEQQLIEMKALAGEGVEPVVALPAMTGRRPVVDFEKAWSGRPDVAALLLAEERASVQRSLAAKGLAPVLDLFVGLRLGEDYRSPYVENNRNEVLAKAVLTIPLADGGKTSNATGAATLLLDKARLDLRAKRDGLQREVDLVRERWDRAFELESIRRRQAESAAEELEIAEMMYREGLASQLDLINAQEADQRTRSEHLAALQEMWLVLAEEDRVSGRYVHAPRN